MKIKEFFSLVWEIIKETFLHPTKISYIEKNFYIEKDEYKKNQRND